MRTNLSALSMTEATPGTPHFEESGILEGSERMSGNSMEVE